MTARRGAVEWTLDELDRLPDDGLQYELLDGLLLVTPSPVLRHQELVGGLYLVLRRACTPEVKTFLSPVDWRPDDRTSLQPDLLVVRRDKVGVKNLTGGLVLAVEVLSPSTRRKDQVLKRSKYEDAGVQSYWIVDPEESSLLAMDLVDGRYREVAHVTGAETARLERPFPIAITPASLLD